MGHLQKWYAEVPRAPDLEGRGQGQELETRSIDARSHRECLDSNLLDTIWMPVLAIIMIVPAVNDLWLDVVHQKPSRLASQQVLITVTSSLDDGPGFSKGATFRRLWSR